MPAIENDWIDVQLPPSSSLSEKEDEWVVVSDSQAEHAATIREYYLAKATYYWNKK